MRTISQLGRDIANRGETLVPMFVGWDRGGLRHAVCVGAGSGAGVDRFEVGHDRAGLDARTGSFSGPSVPRP
jgi:hypothetical protein